MPCRNDLHWPAAPAPTRWWLGCGMAAATLLSGCTPLPLTPTPAPAPASAPEASPAPPPRYVTVLPAPAAPLPDPADAAARRLLAYNETLRNLPPAEWTREQARLAVGDRADDTLALALLLGQTRQPGDLARALTLLAPLMRDDSPHPAHSALARLLHARLSEQRRLEELSERQAQQLREQQRRLDQLSQQLDALRAIERSLGARPPAAPVAPVTPASSAPRTP